MSADHVEKFNRKQVEEKERIKKIYDDTLLALQTEERFVNLFKDYNHVSIESFIKQYAQLKSTWYEHAAGRAQFRRSMQNQWRYAAVSMLHEIFLKKLFNLKCRWIAGEMDLEGVDVSADFENWEHDPSLARSIAPITPEELECYLEFTEWYTDEDKEQDQKDERGSASSAVGIYHTYRCQSMDDEHCKGMIPRWFYFYDSHFGTAPLMHLPIPRQHLEQDYQDIWAIEIYRKTLTEEQLKKWSYHTRHERAEWKKHPEKLKEVQTENQRRWEETQKTEPKYTFISVHNQQQMKKLIALIETKEMQEYYQCYKEWNRRQNGNESIQSILITMTRAKEYIAIDSSDDYRTGIDNAYNDYARKMTQEALQSVFEEYVEAMAANLPFNWKRSEYESSHVDSSLLLKERFLEVRKLRGEPENFDFLKKENLPKE